MQIQQSRPWQPYAALAIGLAAVASSSILVRYAQNAEAGSLVIAMWRCGLAALILTPLVIIRYRPSIAQLTRAEVGLALLSGAFLAVHFASWITSLEYASVLTSTTLVTTNPLIVALATPFLLGEKLNRVTLYAILLAMAGGFLISIAGTAGSAPRQDAPLLGVALALIGSVTVAAYYIIGRRLRARLPVIPYIWMTYGTAGIVLVSVVVLSGQPVLGLTGNAYLWMTLTALVPQLIGHSSFNYALGYLSAAYVSLTVLVEPVLSTILAIFLLEEHPTAGQILGGVLILTALVIASRVEARSEREKHLPAESQVVAT